MRTRHLFFTLVLAALMAIPQGIVAQKPAASTESEAKDVSYTLGKKNNGRADIPRLHRMRSGRQLKERRYGKNDLPTSPKTFEGRSYPYVLLYVLFIVDFSRECVKMNGTLSFLVVWSFSRLGDWWTGRLVVWWSGRLVV